MLIDAKDLIAGRVAAFAAKNALLGEPIDIINCEKAVIVGSRAYIIERYRAKKRMGTYLGPFYPKNPDMFMRRLVRGMIAHKTVRGRKAFSKVKCFIGVPRSFEGKKAETIIKSHISKLPHLKYITIKDICKQLGSTI